MEESSDQRKEMYGLDLRIFYLILSASGPFVVYSVSAIIPNVVLWGMQFSDILDVAILGPYFALVIALLWWSFYKTTQPGTQLQMQIRSRVTGYVSLFLFFEGHAMHFAANAIDNYAKKILTNPQDVPEGLLNIIHFLDEFLGHALAFTGLYGLIFTGVLIERENQFVDVKKNEIIIASIVGFLMGSLVAVSSIEATYFIGFSLICASLTVILLLREKPFRKAYWQTRPFALAAFFLAIGLIFAASLYYVIVGGFIPPSEL